MGGSSPQTVLGHSSNSTERTALPVQRRALATLLLSPALIPVQGLVQGATASTVDFEDKEDGFRLVVPEDWTFAVPQQPYDRFRCFYTSFT